MALTLKELSDEVVAVLEAHPEVSDEKVWTHIDYCMKETHMIDVLDEGNKRVVVTWMKDQDTRQPFTLKTFSERLLSIIDSRPELSSEHIWRHMYPTGCNPITRCSVDPDNMYGFKVVVRDHY